MKKIKSKKLIFFISLSFISLIFVGVIGAIIRLINLPAILITIIIIGGDRRGEREETLGQV